METKVGANSKITDCLVAKPIKFRGINGLVRLSAVCMATTAPIKKEINMMIPKELKISSSISLNIRDLIILHFVGFLKTSRIIMA
ncbi:hypothetical protein MARI151_10736 [Maribacter litoralis]|uniref:Uncharacterized protein n=1 Tax=Maribacter litoralis TaxID=2059726 RepID=A0A653NNQ1_9FLAO|nr:hypothetical protein MARI151_10736 [Maribacter litoralis]